MQRIFGLLLFLAAMPVFAQVSGPSSQSRVAGRFVASNYGRWSIPVYTPPNGTGSKTFTVTTATATLPDGRTIMPFNTNAQIVVGSETVTVSAVGGGCVQGAISPGACVLTATFSNVHSNADKVSPATFGLQEALNDASASGGGTVVVDSAWTGLGGTLTMTAAATIPTSVGIESEISGPGTITSLQVGTAAPLPGAVISASQSNVGATTQITVQNTSSDSAASSDFIANSDNATNTAYYGDFGCNSSTYTVAAYNSGGADDCYIYAQSGNFNIATATSGKKVTINAGGTTSTNTIATFGQSAITFAVPFFGGGPALISPTTITSASFVTTGLVMPTIPVSTTAHGHCAITWEQTTGVATISFGAGMSNTPTDLWITSKINTAATGANVVAWNTQTATTATIIGAATTPAVAATPYYAEFDFVLQVGATNPVALTFYGLTSNTSDALVIEPGSYCSWLP